MTDSTKRQKKARVLRDFRKVHRLTGALLFVFFFVVSITGLLLGWKKHTGGLILAKTYTGTSTNLKDWLPVDSLTANAFRAVHDSLGADASLTLDRIDMRPDKGTVKFLFVEKYLGVQLDATTGKLLHLETRRADFIENLHDGSILDRWFGVESGVLKVMYSTIMGVALLIFTITGFWLWYGPKRMKQDKPAPVSKPSGARPARPVRPV
ncbi:PepSY-associated TM helix domain-containing protein [Rufibacter latericius]|uniref:PepSY domain-containing protein n=1 Tax=Rufibacter latericius TaxID=2487040 RepID=A0A3M9MV77_9BACT|nr:PepSY-associated TM helix domain-containing protein [Rufibacter latericius]RNI28658.1 PepSY domain-containing protein [Rufibacter latericius]